MGGLTWLQKGEKEFDRQVIRAALIRDIRGRITIGPDLSMIDFIIFMFLKNFRPRSRSLLDPRKRYTEKSEDRSTWTEKI